MQTPPSFEHLVKALSRLPTVGRRSAERMAFKLVEERETILPALFLALGEAQENLAACVQCGNLTEHTVNPCSICRDPGRSRIMCVVEDAAAIMAIEKSGGHNGVYHALGGVLSPMRGKGPDELRIQVMLERIPREKISEILIALNTDVESDGTARYLLERLSGRGVRITRLAFGLPAGGSMEYADSLTLSRAVQGRVALG